MLSPYFTVRIQLIRSPFSWALHSRLNTSSQLRRNHFSTFFTSLKRAGVMDGANGSSVRKAGVLPGLRGSLVWQLAQLMALPLAVLSRTVFTLVVRAFRPAPDIFAKAPVDLMLRVDTFRHL